MRNIMSALLFSSTMIISSCAGTITTTPPEISRSIDTAVGVCLDILDNKVIRDVAEFRKARLGHVREFAESEGAILEDKLIFNGSRKSQIRVFRNYGYCDLDIVKISGGFATHLDYLVQAFERRGWSYNRPRRELQKGTRILNHNGSQRVKIGSQYLISAFKIIEKSG